MFHTLSIDYDEASPKGSYRGVVVRNGTSKREVQRWMTGDPQADWAAYLAWAKAEQIRILETSSITHFLHDVPGWRMVVRGDGHEIIIPEDRPIWLAHEAEKHAGH